MGRARKGYFTFCEDIIMKVCYFGAFDREYSRNRVLLKGLKDNGVEVFFANSHKNGFLSRGADLYRKYKKTPFHDVVVVGYSDSRSDVLWARLFSRKKIVWDPLYSLYDARVNDRKLVKKMSVRALFYFVADVFNFHLSNAVISDTNEHAEYFSRTFKISKRKITRVFVGSDNELFHSEKTKENSYSVGFYGKYIPLQGIETIVRAAFLLETEKLNINFLLIGTGQTFDGVYKEASGKGLKNVTFKKRVPYHALPSLLSECEILLGIFGTTEKAQRVIPNKVYDAAALGKPVITMESKAIRELFEDRKTIFLVEKGSPEKLAQKIKEVVKNKEEASTVAEKALSLYRERLTPTIIGKEFLSVLSSCTHDRK